MKVGLLQITSVLDPIKNLDKIRSYKQQISSEKVELLFLPEYFFSFDDGKKLTPYLVEKGNEYFEAMAQLAKELGVYLLGGTATTKESGKIYNRVYNFSPKGELISTYDKRHLFSCDIFHAGKRRIVNEADHYSAGHASLTMNHHEWKLGFSVCFDLRYSDLFLDYSKQGVNLHSLSAAFTVPTGRAHWHTLLRARAIETQSFLVATAQYGVHNDSKETYGHSLIIDPWGEILVDAGEGEKLVTAELDYSLLEQTRKRVILNL